MRNFKEARRTAVLQILETRELEAAKAEERNEVRELSEEEQCLKDFAFPDKLALPIDKRFRLWLSTVPVPGFPQDFARRCCKVAVELPSEVRLGAQKSLSTMPTAESIDRIGFHKATFRKLLFSVTVMHAVINQREHYGSFGWT